MTEISNFLIDNNFKEPIKKALTRLLDLGYNEEGVCKRLGVADMNDIVWRALPIYRKERLSLRNSLDCAIELFFMQGFISIEELNVIFNLDEQKALIECDIILIDKNECAARASCYPVGNNLIFSDHAWPKLPHPGYLDVPFDQVMYIGADSRWLAHAALRRPIDSALDLCTGSGIHAILAAQHSKRVIAVDISPRAVKCTNFNAFAFGLSNVTAIVGDLYENVGDERFDLITANPPFVPSPVKEIGYRDGGSSGEEVQRRIIKELPRYLAPNGIAQIVTEFGEREGETLIERLRTWLNGAPMDILILRLRTHSASVYATGHASADGTYGEHLEDVDRWASNLRAHGYVQIASVLIAFKWSDSACGEPWGRIEDIAPPTCDIGFAIEDIFTVERFLRSPNLFETLKNQKIYRAGKIGLLEARELGGAGAPKAQAQLLGTPIAFGKWLDATELSILLALESPLTLSELSIILNVNEETLFDKVCALIKSRILIS